MSRLWCAKWKLLFVLVHFIFFQKKKLCGFSTELKHCVTIYCDHTVGRVRKIFVLVYTIGLTNKINTTFLYVTDGMSAVHIKSNLFIFQNDFYFNFFFLWIEYMYISVLQVQFALLCCVMSDHRLLHLHWWKVLIFGWDFVNAAWSPKWKLKQAIMFFFFLFVWVWDKFFFFFANKFAFVWQSECCMVVWKFDETCQLHIMWCNVIC